MPKSFDLKGIFALVTGLLGLTYQGIRNRVANKVGEKKVSALEKGFDMFILWKNEGAAGLWKFIQDKLTNLKEMVMGGIQGFVIDSIINAGVTWVLSLLNPASAFVRACKLIIDVIMFFVERGSQIAELVNAVLDSVNSIADGAIGVAAKLVEGALGKALPVVIGFLASLIGLGGISGKIRSLIEKARGLIDKAIDWVMSKAIAFVKKLGDKLGLGRGSSTSNQNDPNHDQKVAAGLSAIDVEEKSYIQNGKISHEDAKKVAIAVKRNHSVFKSLTVIDGGGTWDYEYVASPKERKKGAKQQDKAPANPEDFPRHEKRARAAESFRVLENGKIRYYDPIRPAQNEGPSLGARLVKEVDRDGNVRSWYETIDKETGKPRQIRVEQDDTSGIKVKKHYLKDPNSGKVTGVWSSIFDVDSKTWVRARYDRSLGRWIKE